MDVFFDVQRGKTFCIEVGYFDSVLEIKEKVHKYQGIPVSKQTLVLKGQALQDSDDVWKCEILHNSRIQLLVAPDTDKPSSPLISAVKREDVASPPSTKIHLNVKAISSNAHLPLEIDVNESVLRLKEKIHEMEAVPVNRLLLHVRGSELHDHQLLKDCDVSDNSEIGASLVPLPTASATSSGSNGGGSGGMKKPKMTVFVKNETKKIPIEVNAMDNVGELRKELHKLNEAMQFSLPPESYFFIYNQNVMDDDKSFRWHHVGQGDSIEIFNGSVTGGS